MEYENYFEKVDESAAWLKKKINIVPKVLVVLSGGLDGFVDSLEDNVLISSLDIPHFPMARAEGHAGKLVFGLHGNMPLCAMQGRFHYYEGHAPNAVVFPVFVMAMLGAKTLIATNAAGGVNKSFKPGDIMVVTDHINMMGMNPLIGLAVQREKDQFTSLTNAYDKGLQDMAAEAAMSLEIDLKSGVYLAASGPSYETKAEIKVYRDMGADAVGMSTVPEVIAANFLGMKALAFSCIANPAADIHDGEMTHKEVLDAMNALAPKVVALLGAVVHCKVNS